MHSHNYPDRWKKESERKGRTMEKHEYRYYRDTEQALFRMHIEPDIDPWNPRTDMDGNIGTMFCMHSRYHLGDKTPYQDEDGLKRAIIEELHIPMKKIQAYTKTGKANIDLKYNRQEKQWEIWGEYRFAWKRHYGLYSAASELDDLEDDLIDGITFSDLQNIAGQELISLPLYLYDHSGLSMSVTDFGDRWDSGQVGIIWTTIDRVKTARGGKQTKAEWSLLAKKNLKDEVEMYNQYLQGEVYGYIEEKQTEDGKWEESDSCWGYYTDTIDPLCELADEIWGVGNHMADVAEMPNVA